MAAEEGARVVAERVTLTASAAASALTSLNAELVDGLFEPDAAQRAIAEHAAALGQASAFLANRGVTAVPPNRFGLLEELERLATEETRGSLLPAVSLVAAMEGELPSIADGRRRAADLLVIAPERWTEEQAQLALAFAGLVDLQRLASSEQVAELALVGSRTQSLLPEELRALVFVAASRRLSFGKPAEGSVAPRPPRRRNPPTAGPEPKRATNGAAVSPGPEETDEQAAPDAAGAEEDETAAREAEPGSLPPRPADDGDESEARTELSRAIADGRFPLAASLAQALDEPKLRVSALQVAALAASMTSNSGECAARCAHILLDLRVEEVVEDPTARLLTVAAAARAALIAPYGGFAEILRGLTERVRFDSELGELLDAVLQVANTGIPSTATRPGIPGLSDGDRVIASLVGKAAALLRDGPQRTIKIPLATAVWRSWLRPTGYLHSMLEPVAGDLRDKVEEVSSLALQLRDPRELERRVDATSRELRPSKKAPIEAGARTTLLERIREARDIAAAWADTVINLETEGRRDEVKGPVARLLRTAAATRNGMSERMQRTLPADADAIDVAAANGAAGLLEALERIVSGSGVSEQPERSAEEILNEPLMLAWEIPLSGGQARGRLPTGPLVAVARGRSLPDAIAGRCAAGDFDVVDQMIALLRPESGAAVEPLARHAEEALAAERAALGDLAERCRIDLETALRQGIIHDAEYFDLDLIRNEATGRTRLDLRSARAELDWVAEELAEGTRRARAELESQLAALDRDGDARHQISSLLETGDIGTARFYLDLVHAGRPVPELEPPTFPIQDFFPRVVEGLEGIQLDQKVLGTIEDGGDLGPLSFANVPPAARSEISRAVASWMRLRTRRGAGGGVLHDDLKAILGVLGIKMTQLGRSDDFAAARTSRVLPVRWVEVGGDPNEQALVPQLGSMLRHRFQLLLCWGSPSEKQLHQWVSDRGGDNAVFVLYFGLAPAVFRQHLADQVARPGRGVPPILLIDDAVVLVCAAQPRSSYEVTQRLTLPFTAVNPYDPFANGEVPPEMFFGRGDEQQKVVSSDGPCLLYGGRKLGKSALLRAAERTLNDGEGGTAALYIDLSGRDWGGETPTDDLWRQIDDRLGALDIPVGAASRLQNMADRVTRRIEAWLAKDDERRLVLLLDEVDTFLNADGERQFPVVNALRRLRDTTRRRVKPVLAGLHQVARFSSAPNQPFAHFESIVIGPLAVQEALDLTVKPLEALGYVVEDSAATRILAYTQFNPGLIQLFCRELVRHLNRRQRQRRSLPAVVTIDHVEQVHADADLTSKLRERFMATLNLDHRYLVIAYTLALQADGPDGRAFVDALDLQRRCLEYWPVGFGTGLDEFRGLLEELLGLGLLGKSDENAYRIANPHVRRMLGREFVGQSLEDTDLLQPPTRFGPSLSRGAFNGDPLHRSPLTAMQVGELLDQAARCRLVLGTPATHAERVPPALVQEAGRHPSGLMIKAVTSPDDLEAVAVRLPTDGSHVVLVADVHALASKFDESLVAMRQFVDRHRVSAVVVGGGSLDHWSGAASEERPDVDVVVLERWDMQGLYSWLINLEEAPLGPDQLRKLLEVTGGWPYLVERVISDVTRGQGLDQVLEEQRRSLEPPEGALTLLTAVGLHQPSPVREAFGVLVEWEALEPRELSQLMEEVSPDNAIGDALRLLGVATVDPKGALRPEPAVAGAWKRWTKA